MKNFKFSTLFQAGLKFCSNNGNGVTYKGIHSGNGGLRSSKNRNLAQNEIQRQTGQSGSPSLLRGRDLVNFDEFSTNDILSILWAAVDLKTNPAQLHKICGDTRAFCIFEDTMTKIALTNAAKATGASITFVHDTNVNPNYDLTFYGKSLSSAADIIFVDSPDWKESDIEKLATGSTVPVINVRSGLYSPGVALAECMSVHEHYEFLRRLTLSYIGPNDNPLLNTYVNLLPKLGIHVRYVVDGTINKDVWDKGLVLAKAHNTELHHCDSMADAIFRANIISTCFHNLSELFITVKDIKEMDLNWTLLHHEVYKSATVAPDLLHSKQSLAWSSIDNLAWIMKAIMVSTTTSFEPTGPRPKFEGIE